MPPIIHLDYSEVDRLISSSFEKDNNEGTDSSNFIININNTEDSEPESLDWEAEATAAASDTDNPTGFSEEDSLIYSISRKTTTKVLIFSILFNNNNTGDSESEPIDWEAEAIAATSDPDNPTRLSEEEEGETFWKFNIWTIKELETQSYLLNLEKDNNERYWFIYFI